MSKKLLTTNTMMTRNQTAIAATAATTTVATANTIAITDNTGDTVIYPTMFDRWKLAI